MSQLERARRMNIFMFPPLTSGLFSMRLKPSSVRMRY